MFDGNYVSAPISVPKGWPLWKPRPADAGQVRPLAEGVRAASIGRAATRPGSDREWLGSRRVRKR